MFRQTSSLNLHVKAVHEGRKDYECKHCAKPFATTTLLRIHEPICPNNEHKVKVNCDKCGKSFTQRRCLKLHIKNVHEGRRDHKCETCGKSFSVLANMRKHINTVHLGLKKFQCPFCNTAYGQNGDLGRHIKRCHSKEKQNLKETEKNETK